MGWTEEQLREYTERRLKDEARVRTEIIQQSARIARCNPKSGYNPSIVLAWFEECGLPEPRCEYQFDPDRKWRFDFAWPELAVNNRAVALEVQGGLWTSGRHVRGAALLKEHEKLNRAAVLGWRVLFTTPDQLCTKEMADTIHAALAL